MRKINKKHMMIIKIMGGYGNQMFQYAYAMEMRKLGMAVKVDDSWYSEIQLEVERPTAYDLLGIDIEKATDAEINSLRKKYNLFWKIICRINRDCLYAPICYERDHEYRKGFLQDTGGGYYVGYWQSERYFLDVADEVRRKYVKALKEKIDGKNLILEKHICDAHCAVSIHVRGGDYYDAINVKEFGFICDKTYYLQAINMCKECLGNCTFYVFTNDERYCNKVLPSNEHYIFVNNCEAEGYKDIYLMSLCKHNIIANSSFSWWGAWLNNYIDKMVIAPSKWKNGNSNRDIYCKDWIKI